MDRQTFHSFTKWLVDPNESFVMVCLSPPPAPKLTHGTAPIRFARGKATKFSSRDRSGVEQPRHEVPYRQLDLAGAT